jgi:hypothetical protein
MQRINLGFWYQLGAAVRPLLALKSDSPLFEVFGAVAVAHQWVEAALNARVLRLSTSYPSATKLRDALNELVESIDFGTEPLGSGLV